MSLPAADSDHNSGRPRKKRGKYGPRSCVHCRRSKNRCAGGFPCNRCTSRKLQCDRPSAVDGRRVLSSPITELDNTSNLADSNGIFRRLVELSGSVATLARDAEAAFTSIRVSPLGRLSDIDQTSELSSVQMLENSTQNHADLDRFNSTEQHVSRECWDWLQGSLPSFGVDVNQSQWRGFLQAYFSEVHVLFPMLHPPNIWRTFEDIWSGRFSGLSLDFESGGENKMTLGIVFVCMALGRCSSSPRVGHTDDRHSSGWSLYSIGAYLLHDCLDLSRVPRKACLSEVHALLLIAVYFLRINVNDRAHSILGQANTRAHVSGIHKQKQPENMTLFDKEMSIRTRLCLFVIDRELSLESGLPYVVQGKISTLDGPHCLSDDFLDSLRESDKTATQLRVELQEEIKRARPTLMPYLIQCAALARLVGDLWDHFDGALFDRSTHCADHMNKILETRLQETRALMPPFLHHPAEFSFVLHCKDMEWWQIKQQALIHMSFDIIGFLAYDPGAKLDKGALDGSRPIAASDAVCAQRALRVIRTFDQIPSEYPKFVLPFLWYISSSTILLLSMAFRYPLLRAEYSSGIRSALCSLRQCFSSTWVSGRTIRMLSRLYAIANGLGLDSTDSASTFLNGREPDLPAVSAALARPTSGILCEALFCNAFTFGRSGMQNSRSEDVPNVQSPVSTSDTSHTPNTASLPSGATMYPDIQQESHLEHNRHPFEQTDLVADTTSTDFPYLPFMWSSTFASNDFWDWFPEEFTT